MTRRGRGERWSQEEFAIVISGRNENLSCRKICQQLRAIGSNKTEFAVNGACRRLRLQKPQRVRMTEAVAAIDPITPPPRSAAQMRRERFVNPNDCRYGR